MACSACGDPKCPCNGSQCTCGHECHCNTCAQARPCTCGFNCHCNAKTGGPCACGPDCQCAFCTAKRSAT
eukprot:jgi/Chlat1/6493/Chrsp45S06063